jgi:hypothetical protein
MSEQKSGSEIDDDEEEEYSDQEFEDQDEEEEMEEEEEELEGSEKETKIPQAIQLEPDHEYAVVMCKDADEWEALKVALNLTPVRRGGYKKGSAFDAVGTQRVVKAGDLLARIGK